MHYNCRACVESAKKKFRYWQEEEFQSTKTGVRCAVVYQTKNISFQLCLINITRSSNVRRLLIQCVVVVVADSVVSVNK